jgi:hypothetical protein
METALDPWLREGWRTVAEVAGRFGCTRRVTAYRLLDVAGLRVTIGPGGDESGG